MALFDIGMDEMLVVAVVAIVVIGPKDLPMALRSVGRWVAKFRKVSGHFRSGIETMIREAELEDMQKKWLEQNAEIMNAVSDPHPEDASGPLPELAEPVQYTPDMPNDVVPPAPKPKARSRKAKAPADDPSLPLPLP